MVGATDLDISNKISLLSNLSFDHPLTDAEFYDLEQLLSSSVLLSQVYFKDNIDIASIDKVKSLLELLPNIDDSKVEKYIMKTITNLEREQLDNMNFANIDTWNIAYLIEGNKYEITSLTKYRIVNEWFNQVLEEMDSKEGLSLLDKICYLYNRVKMFHYDASVKYHRLPEIICDKKANSYGYNLLFKELLLRMGVSSLVIRVASLEDNFITLSLIKDDLYKVDGVYIFDPSSDTIFKDQYKNNLARQMNYNFFAITLNKLENLSDNNDFDGVLKILLSPNTDEYNYYLKNYISRFGNSEIKKIEKSFYMSFEDIFNKLNSSDDISKDTIFKIVSKRLDNYPDVIVSKDFLLKTVSENYIARNSELFVNNRVKKKTIES